MISEIDTYDSNAWMIWIFLIFLFLYLLLKWRKRKLIKAYLIKADILSGKIREIISTQFLVQPCPRCNEDDMLLDTVSPKGKSISYICNHCQKKLRASAATKEAEDVVYFWNEIHGILENLRNTSKNFETTFVSIRFCTPEAIMPYEQTTRKPIPENVKSEVWRRDGGVCVECGTKENLQLDHIIPVSKGGTTSVANLQLLCRACNLKKNTKI